MADQNTEPTLTQMAEAYVASVEMRLKAMMEELETVQNNIAAMRQHLADCQARLESANPTPMAPDTGNTITHQVNLGNPFDQLGVK